MRKNAFVTLLIALTGATLAAPAFAQDKGTTPAEGKASASAPPSDEDMSKMMAMAQPGANHKILAELAGNWTYKLKFWFMPNVPPSESTGTTVCKPIMDGRYFESDTAGKFQMPGANGQMQDLDFKGMAIDTYDNVKQKFVSSWIDNMGTSITMSEGTYDAASKTFTYLGEEESVPGNKTKTRQSIKILDHDHYVMEWYETHDGKEAKMMELDYTRQG